MPSKKTQAISDLKQSNAFLTKKVEHQMLLLSGLQEQLEAATQFNLALLLKLGGEVRLTDQDRLAIVGKLLSRRDAEGGDFILTAVDAVCKPAAASTH